MYMNDIFTDRAGECESELSPYDMSLVKINKCAFVSLKSLMDVLSPSTGYVPCREEETLFKMTL